MRKPLVDWEIENFALDRTMNFIERLLEKPLSMPRRFCLVRAALTAATLALLMTGCQPAMSTQPENAARHGGEPPMFPLIFKVHAFQGYCFNTLTCKIIYNNYQFMRSFAAQPSGPPPSGDYREHWPFASHIGIRNFPPPAQVHWTSLDGGAHDAKVDIGAIFENERVLYTVPDAEIPDRSWGGEPGIFLEVNDRTINVYMKAFIATKTEQISGNKDSDFRDDVILAWSHTY
ncbi:MAG: hypothetical protein ABI767_05885 [Rhodanobacter sp.]